MRRSPLSKAAPPIATDLVCKNFLAHSRNAIFVVNCKNQVVYASPSCRALFGYSPEECRHIPRLAERKLLHPDCRPQFVKFWRDYAKTKKFPTKPSEWKWTRKDGKVIYTENNFINLYEKGRIIGFLTIAEDITRRQEMVWSINRLNSLLRAMTNIDQLIMKEKNELNLTQGFCEILRKTMSYELVWFGKVEESIRQVNCIAEANCHASPVKSYCFSWGADYPKHCPVIKAIKSRKIAIIRNPQRFETKIVCQWHSKGIKKGYLSMAVVPIVIDNKVVAIFGVHSKSLNVFHGKEIVLLKDLAGDLAFALRALQMEQKLARETALMHNLIDFNPYAMVLGGVDGAILRVNKVFVNLFGSIPPPGYNIFKDPLLKQAGYGKFFKQLWSGRIVEFPKIWYNAHKIDPKLPDKDICIKSVLFPVKDVNGKIDYIVGMHENITQAAEIDKTKSEFVSLASHQLRTPLASIKWFTEMLLNKDVGPLTSEQEEMLNEVMGANQRMVSLVNALLNISRLEMGTLMIMPTRINLIDFADECIAELAPLIAERGVRFTREYQIDKRRFFTDRDLLAIILQNLLSNAIWYTPEGGKVSLGIARQKNNILITVADTGIGIPLKARDSIYTKLYRADNARKVYSSGTGLGLYIVKSILDYVGGKIWFESPTFIEKTSTDKEEGKGTTFYVSLPLKGMPKKRGTKSLIKTV